MTAEIHGSVETVTRVAPFGLSIPLPETYPVTSWEPVDYTPSVSDEIIRSAAVANLAIRGVDDPSSQEVELEILRRVQDFCVARRAEVLERVRDEHSKITLWLEKQGEQ